VRDSQPRHPAGRGRRRPDGPRRPRSSIDTSFPEEVARLEDALDALALGPPIVVDPAEAQSPRPSRRGGPTLRLAGRSVPIVLVVVATLAVAAGIGGATLAVRDGLPLLRTMSRTVVARIEPAAPEDTAATPPLAAETADPPAGPAETVAAGAPAGLSGTPDHTPDQGSARPLEPVRIIPEPGAASRRDRSPPLPDLADVGKVPEPAIPEGSTRPRTSITGIATEPAERPPTSPPDPADLRRAVDWLVDPAPRVRLQLAAVDTRAAAEAAWADLTADPDSPLAAFAPTIEAVEEPQHTWYRLVVDGLPDTAGKAICDRLLAAFAGCIVQDDDGSALQPVYRFAAAARIAAEAASGSAGAATDEPSAAEPAARERDPRYAALLRVEIFRSLRDIGYQPGTGIGRDTPAFRRAIRDFRADTALTLTSPAPRALADELAALAAAGVDRATLRDIARRRTQAIQAELRRLDFYRRALHGALDRATRDSIGAYRMTWRLPEDVTPLALLGHLTVAAVQRRLSEEALYDGPVTGTADAATRAAVDAYRRDRGLPPGGSIDRGLLELLRSAETAPEAEAAGSGDRSRYVGDLPTGRPVLR